MNKGYPVERKSGHQRERLFPSQDCSQGFEFQGEAGKQAVFDRKKQNYCSQHTQIYD